MTDTLVFSHANSFPLPVYRRLFEALELRGFACTGVPRFGHDPARPPSVGWPHLTDELLDFVHAMPSPGRLWLIGHSLGGYLSVLAAARLGARVAGVVMLDSPVIAGHAAAMVRVGRATGLDRMLMPIRQTLQRCRSWPDTDAAHAHYAAKPMFARWHPQVLRDYAEHGTVADAEAGRRLWFEPEIEFRIYRSLPTAEVVHAGHGSQARIAFIAGTQSREVRQVGLRATRRLVGERLQWIDGSHLFPMERPDETAESILRAIDTLKNPAP